MQEPDLKPIPIPARQQWREFRVVYLPFLTFLTLVISISWMWIRFVQPSTIIGEVETVRVGVISIVDGTVQELKVSRLESVTNGQVLAVISAFEPDQIQAELAAAEADLRLLKARMDLDRTRNLNAYSQLRAELQLELFQLEAARIRLVQAEEEYTRTKQLWEHDLAARGSGGARNDFGLDVALRDRDALIAEVAAREKMIAELREGVEKLETVGAGKMEATDALIEEAIAAQRERLVHLQGTIVLRSPINGFVSVINHMSGSKVTAGDDIMVVSAEKSDRILAWVRQPVTDPPHAGDIVQVRRAALGEPAFQATIVKVGKQLEEINPTAVPLSASIQRAEFGLPLIIQVDNKPDLIPGEAVQLQIVKRVSESVNQP